MKRILGLISVLCISVSSWGLTNAVVADEPSFDTLVFYSAPQWDPELKEVVQGYCNGQLISPRVMITAAHCVANAYSLNQPTLDIQIGEYLYATNRTTGERVRVGYASKIRQKVTAQFYFVPSLKARLDSQKLRTRLGPSDDFAVVVWNQDLTLKPTDVFPEVVSQKEVAGIVPSILKYRPTVVTINPIEEMSTHTRRKAVLNSLSKTFSGYLESKSVARLAPGDSGAPLFVQVGPSLKLIGVVKGRAETFFSNWDVYGLLDSKLCQVSQQIPDRAVQDLICH